MTDSAEYSTLNAVIASIWPLLEPRGFHFTRDDGTASNGTFANVTFRRADFEFGLIVRHGDKLGCPNYSYGGGYVGHDDVIRQLGRSGDEALIPNDSTEYRARNGGNAIDALRADLERFILPALDTSEHDFADTIHRALEHARAERGW